MKIVIILTLFFYFINASVDYIHADGDGKLDKIITKVNQDYSIKISINMSRIKTKRVFYVIKDGAFDESLPVGYGLNIFSGVYDGELCTDEYMGIAIQNHFVTCYMYNKDIDDWIAYQTIRASLHYSDEQQYLQELIIGETTEQYGIKKGNSYDNVKRDILSKNLAIDELKKFSKCSKNQQPINFFKLLKLLTLYPLSEKNVNDYNRIVFCLAGGYQESAYLLEKIIEKFPNRTVAYLNLGDAYYGLGYKTKAMEAYQIYINQMKKKGWEKKIPKQVLERTSTNLETKK